MSIKIDPEIKSLIPSLSRDEYRLLEESIVGEKRCREKVVTWNNVMLDGHNRQEICERHGIGYGVLEMKFPDRDAAIAWVIKNQLGRRNISDHVRVELALRLEKHIAEKARENQRNSGKALPQNSAEALETREVIAAAAGVSRDTVSKVKNINENATTKLADMSRAGDVSINAAATVARLPRSEQRAIAAKGADAVKEKAREIREAEKEKLKPKAKKKSAPTPNKEEQLVDDTGHPIPDDDGLRKAFAARESIDATAQDLVRIKSFAKAFPGFARYTTIQHFENDCNNARRAILHARPHAVCPYCDGTGKKSGGNCGACKGDGWVNKVIYESAPKELKSERKAA